MRIFFVLFLLFPLAELYVLIKVGGSIGALATIMLLVLSGIAGILLLRLAGFATAWRARERLARGELPEREMLQGLMMAIGGGLLFLPGFISDVLALIVLFPPTRNFLFRQINRRIEAQVRRQRAFADDLQARSNPQRPNVIEGEWERNDRDR
ncbi:FxsA family protein [Stutzerimonas stutzeri]|uniref:Membrane protein FxsA n=1 Tax=Stutzerimonas stutzeri TaxID=316 RepID=A0A2N8RGG9_STUST|nr:FxsA family protein [Stutzerimonas stutzeri]KRW66283.1 exclusion suppressor FxsA [Pseudomonas sp. TTU2014-105ASC]MDH2242357.1 membrane protein FxsA [Pseudomonas sp. GD03909]EHY78743.1 phage T7 F exclusion suppressor FxsA [Stutzerimonas stutzeri ATCC 14405 = CCUG 16156]MCQ4253611.1 membrane protein FxsA [Stutzerimonas stutzeri]PNF60182.1 membrane protein FxsA [Stutzerimonas stutzeri]